MYLLFNTNVVIGAFKDQSTGRLEVDFSQALGEKDMHISEFSQRSSLAITKNIYISQGGKKKLKISEKYF